MNHNSNQSGALLLLAIVLGAAVYALMFFGSEVEQTNLSASFRQLAKPSTVNLYSHNEKSIQEDISISENTKELSINTLPSYKMKNTSGGVYSKSTNSDFVSTEITQVDIQNTNQSITATATNTSDSPDQSQFIAFGNSNVHYITNPQNPTKSDISALLLFDTYAADATEVAKTVQQGSKRATPALAGKTAISSTDNMGHKIPKKIDGSGNPGEPTLGGSLPIGDGMLILLLLATFYSLRKANIKFKFPTLKNTPELTNHFQYLYYHKAQSFH